MSKLSQRLKTSIFLFLMLVHTFVFWQTFGQVGTLGIAFSLITVIFAAMAWGYFGGGLVSIGMFFYNLFLIHHRTGSYYLDNLGLIFGSAVLVLIGVFVGWTVEKDKRIQKELIEREKIEQELEEMQHWYRNIFNGVSDAIFVETVRGEILDVNARACQIFGWTRDEFLTKTVRDLVPPEYAALLPDEEEEIHLSEEPFETVNMRANGETFPVSVSGRIRKIGDKERLLIVLRDITEKKRAEKQLQEQHQFLVHVIESLTQPFYVINVEDYSIALSNSAASVDGNVSGRTCYALTHQREEPCAGDEHPCPLREVMETKASVQVEHIHYDASGKVRILDVHGYPIFDKNGEVVQMIEYSIDVTEKRKAEEELLKLSRAVTHSPTPVVITDAAARIEYVNPAYLERGFTEEEILGKYATFFFSDLHPKEFYKEIWRKVSAGETWRGEIGSRNRDDEIIWDEVSITPVLDENGKIINFVGVMENVTARKKLLEETEKAKEAAEAAVQAKADFLANMSHEIRTPLNAIYGMTSLMLDTPLNAEQQDFIETIRSGSDTLLTVINSILDFSKIEAGKMEFERHPFRLRDCVEETLDLLAEKAAGKMLDLAYMIEDGTPDVVVGDVTRVRQILVNLLNNAIKFTDAGEVVVYVKNLLVENGQHEIQFAVRDTGIGIPKNRLDKLFKSFSQVDSSTTRKYGGTGLGLAISKELAERMGGSIWVESEEGKGSTFYFSIVVDAEEEASILEELDYRSLSGKRILVVDDNATNRLILAKQTESWGMKATAVASGFDALQLLADGQTFDLAILDMQMPEMDGFTLAEKIKEECDEKAPPILILTSIKRDKSRLTDPKIEAFLSKPIRVSNLFNILHKIVTKMPEPRLKKKPALQIDSGLSQKHPLRILLAEDNLINQKVALKMLERLGYAADIAANGTEAVDAVKRQPYDLVFMDIQMPEMDGDEATKRIREALPKEKQPYIVAMTAHALEGDREKYIARGMDDYISKPVKLEALIKAIQNAPAQKKREK